MLNNLFKINKKQSKNKEKSRGRSMVEMLGVLAIIGVLSIGGISGYTIAMRRYRANEILNVANKYALILYSNCQTAMMNDGYTNWISSGINWHCPTPVPFSDSGLGGLPSGADVISVNRLGFDDVSDQEYIVSTQSGDYVGLRVAFETKELCEIASTMVGEEHPEHYPSSDFGAEGYKPCETSNILIFSVHVD